LRTVAEVSRPKSTGLPTAPPARRWSEAFYLPAFWMKTVTNSFAPLARVKANGFPRPTSAGPIATALAKRLAVARNVNQTGGNRKQTPDRGGSGCLRAPRAA
jgi:hypothetical protein